MMPPEVQSGFVAAQGSVLLILAEKEVEE